MTCTVFLSYRRDDSAGYAGRLYDSLVREFGRDQVFMDVEGILPGDNVAKVLAREISKCNALLALIGPGWLDARDEHGNRRLENSDDLVRVEIKTALERGIPVIPVLLKGARIPKAPKLPYDLSEISMRNGIDVRHASFPGDVQSLVHALKVVQSRQQTALAVSSPEYSEAGRTGTQHVAADARLRQGRRQLAFWLAALAIGITAMTGASAYRNGTSNAAAGTRVPPGSSCTVNDPTGTPLNVRAGPNGPILGALANGASVEIRDTTVDRTGRRWAYIAPLTEGKSGWVFQLHLDCE